MDLRERGQDMARPRFKGDPTEGGSCSEMGCHSDPSTDGEESHPGFSWAVRPTRSKIPRFARNYISCFLGAVGGIRDCLETKKDVFVRNEPKELLKTKGFAVFRRKNELYSTPLRRKTNPIIGPNIGPPAQNEPGNIAGNGCHSA